MSTVEKSAVSRRKVAAGIAWSVPVIAAASVAPFAAASPRRCLTLLTPTFTGACTTTSAKILRVSYGDGNNAAPVSITAYVRFQIPASYPIPANGTVSFDFAIGNVGNGFTVGSYVGLPSGVSASSTPPGGNFTVTLTSTTGFAGGAIVEFHFTVSGLVLTSSDSNITFQMTDTATNGDTANCSASAPYSTTRYISPTRGSDNSGTTNGSVWCRSGNIKEYSA